MIPRYRAAIPAILLFLAASAASAAYSPSTTNGWFIVVGRVTGVGGAQFRTDVWVFNPDTVNFATVTLLFHGQVSSGGGAPAPISSSPITLAPRETKLLADVLLSTVPADGQVGTLEWQSDRPIMGGMRSYTAPSGCGIGSIGICVIDTSGTFGAFLPGIPTTESMGPKQSATDSSNVLQIFGTNSGDPNYRTQLDLINTSSGSVTIEVKVIDPVTALIYVNNSYAVAGKSLFRVGRILESSAVPVINGLRVTVAIKEGTAVAAGGLLAVGETLDNRSQDQYAFVGLRQSGAVVPAEMLPVEVLP